ncbi:MAG: putative metal-dependent peptidase, partial [Pseudohongiellaceae bacterium]
MNSDNEALSRRLFNVVPAASYQMEKLLSLVDIVFSDAVPTAAVECTRAPRMLLNPTFVREFCQRDGHLLMLVMHELHHVILGHTSLFPRHSLTHNIAFDAVINAMLCRQFPSEADFFRSTNGWDSFPGRLLRPSPGWP